MILSKGTLALASSEQPFIKIIDGATGIAAADFESQPPSTGNGCAFSPDGSKLAVAHNSSPYITIYNTSDGSKIANPANKPASTGNGCAFSPDGSMLAVAHNNSPYITIYNTSDWSKITNPASLPASTAYGCAFSPDGLILAVAHKSGSKLTLYNTADWSKIATPATVPAGQSFGCAFSPDGSTLAVAHINSPYITLYNTSDWSKIANPSTKPASTGHGCAFSPDGTKLAVTHNNSPFLIIYNTADWSSVVGAVGLLRAGSFNGNNVVWRDNLHVLISTDGVPGVIEYDATDGKIISEYTQCAIVLGLAIVDSAGWEINGTIEESLAADTWIATAYDYHLRALLSSVEFTGTTFTLEVANPAPVFVTIAAKQGAMWIAATPYQLGDKVFSTDPVTTPYYYAATSAGTSAISEPVFPVGAGETVGDGSITWTRIERLIEPVSQGPILPTPK